MFKLSLACLLLLPLAAAAQTRPAAPAANTPKALGKFEDWQAATFSEGGQTVCYAFTRARSTSATPAISGRGEVLLTVTHRLAARDAVSIGAGFQYAANAAVVVQADAATLDFYTAQRSAFAREGRQAVTAFQKAGSAVAKSPGPKGPVADTFSLKGFSAAYAAIGKACPPK